MTYKTEKQQPRPECLGRPYYGSAKALAKVDPDHLFTLEADVCGVEACVYAVSDDTPHFYDVKDFASNVPVALSWLRGLFSHKKRWKQGVASKNVLHMAKDATELSEWWRCGYHLGFPREGNLAYHGKFVPLRHLSVDCDYEFIIQDVYDVGLQTWQVPSIKDMTVFPRAVSEGVTYTAPLWRIQELIGSAASGSEAPWPDQMAAALAKTGVWYPTLFPEKGFILRSAQVPGLAFKVPFPGKANNPLNL